MGPTELSFPRIIFLSRNDQQRRRAPELVREKKKQDKKTMFQLHCCFYYYCIAQGVQEIIFPAPTSVSKSVEHTVLGSCKTTFARDCIFVEGEIFVGHPVHVLYYCCHKVQSQQK